MYIRIFSMHLIAFLLLTSCVPASNIPQPALPVSTAISTSGPSATSTVTSAPQTVSAPAAVPVPTLTYNIVDTGQGKCYDNNAEVTCPRAGEAFFGQDAQYTGNAPSYALSADGLIVNDNVTGLTWQRSPDTNGDGFIDKSDKVTWTQAQALPAKLNASKFGGYNDWRLPNIKELYSLIDFRGTDPSGATGKVVLTPFIDTTYFQFAYGDSKSGERTIDSQYASSTMYVNLSLLGVDKLFGVNFADGRIKGYDLNMPGGAEKTFFVICVRGNNQYGLNHFIDDGDQTVMDYATGLTWAKTDSGSAMNWQEAFAWVLAQNAANYLGHNDWRLPNAKELQSIVDYNRSPDTTKTAALDPLFDSTQITNEAGQVDFPFYWTATTHVSSDGSDGAGIYIAFGRAMGYMDNAWVDVHGAGAQRSDPKSGDASRFPQGRGPQGDAIRINNYVRLVRGGNVTFTTKGNPDSTRPTMTVESNGVQQNQSGGVPGQGGSLPGGPGGTPPLGAIDACSAGTQGSSCQLNTPRGSVSGTCRQIQQHLACVPANLGGQP